MGPTDGRVAEVPNRPVPGTAIPLRPLALRVPLQTASFSRIIKLMNRSKEIQSAEGLGKTLARHLKLLALTAT